MISECSFYALPIHLSNLFQNLRPPVEPNGHLSTKPNLTTLFGVGTMYLLLLSFIRSKYMFMQIFGLFLYSIQNIEIFKVFLFSRKGQLLTREACTHSYWIFEKKVNPGPSVLSYVQINLQKSVNSYNCGPCF